MTHRKKIDTWWFNLQDLLDRQVQKPTEEDEEATATVTSIGEKKIPVEVFMCKEMDEVKTPPHPLSKVWFVAKCNQEQYKLDIEIDGPDISYVRDAVWARIDKRFEIKWFRYYLVTVSPSRIYDGQGEGLELSYKDVWKGVTWEGRELLKEWNRYGRGDRDDYYRIRPWPGKFKKDNGTIYACIPENEMTKTALEEFCKKIELVRKALEKMCTPENIMNTLTNISGLHLLPPAQEQVNEETKVKNERKKERATPG